MNALTAHTFVAIGFRGQLCSLGVQEYADYQIDDQRPEKRFKDLSHHVTIGLNDPIYIIKATKRTLTEKVGALYLELTTSGQLVMKPFGEFIKINPVENNIQTLQSSFTRFINKVISYVFAFFKIEQEEIYTVSFGEKSFRKPAIATDAVHILRGKNSSGEKVYKLVGIIRGLPPGKDKGATPGGFNNVDISRITKKEIFDSAISTAMSESEEEMEAKLTISSDEKEILRSDYNRESYETKIVLNGQNFDVMILKAGEFKTSDELMSQGGESIENGLGQKRVHIARSVLVYVDLADTNIEDDEALKGFYKPGDDAAKILIANVTPLVEASHSFDAGIAAGRAFREENGWGIIHHGDILGSACYQLNQHLKRMSD